MKVNELRRELDCRSLSSKGLKSQLIARLTKQLKVEEQVVEEPKEPEIPESKVVEEEEPVRTEDDREEEERKKMEEIERQRRERHFILPDESTILVHPNWAAKNGKFDCSIMSLSVLLDYRLEDNKEHSFEISLFAELFNEMLQRDFGYRIYKALAALPAKDEKKDKKVKKDGEKKESEKREIKDKEEEGEEPAAKKTEDEKRKEEPRDDEENEDEGSTTNAEEYDPMEAEDAEDDEDDDDDDSNDRDRKDRRDERRSSKERSSKDKEKKQMVTHDKDLLMAFVYFDQCHCGYLQERDLEILVYTLGLQLSRSQVKMLLNKPLVKETCYYRKLTDRGKDEPVPSFSEAQIENPLGNQELFPALKACAQPETSESSNLIVYNGAMVDVGSMMQKLERSERAREEIEQRLIAQDAQREESEKVKAELEQVNKALSTELEEVKTTLSQTEETLSTTTEQKNIYYELMSKSASSLMSTVKGLMEVLTEEVDKSDEVDGDEIETSQANGADD